MVEVLGFSLSLSLSLPLSLYISLYLSISLYRALFLSLSREQPLFFCRFAHRLLFETADDQRKNGGPLFHQLCGARSPCCISSLSTSIEALASVTCQDNHYRIIHSVPQNREETFGRTIKMQGVSILLFIFPSHNVQNYLQH